MSTRRPNTATSFETLLAYPATQPLVNISRLPIFDVVAKINNQAYFTTTNGIPVPIIQKDDIRSGVRALLDEFKNASNDIRREIENEYPLENLLDRDVKAMLHFISIYLMSNSLKTIERQMRESNMNLDVRDAALEWLRDLRARQR